DARGRGPALAAEPAYVKGLVETQDEGSQLAALLCAAEPGQQVLDLCAGGGGKALALAGQMHNRGQIYAFDDDGRRLAPIYPRLRAGGRGKALAAPRQMPHRGPIYPLDRGGRRLPPTFPRLQPAGARNVQVRAPRGQADVLADLEARCDLVLVDAPCTGTGTW